ncbi:MAG: peptidase S1, partial [Candidatus Solibacter sp.]|nr:peptidase S1 [Candidatus Solibacter sp.]
MRVLRTLFWAALLAAGFVYLTGVTSWDVGRVLRPVRSAGRLWSEPATAASAGFSTDEQNNIDIYKSARDATVFITSTVYTRTFFGVYPEKGTGTGFVISPEGEILTNNHVSGGGSQLTV